jgi:hypothetical protein
MEGHTPMSGFSKTPTATPRAPVRGLWTHADEAMLQSGVYRYAKSDAYEPIRRAAERRRMSVKQFLATVPIEFGGTQPLPKEPER